MSNSTALVEMLELLDFKLGECEGENEYEGKYYQVDRLVGRGLRIG